MTDFRGATLAGMNLKTDNLKGVIITPKQLEMLAGEIGIKVIDSL